MEPAEAVDVINSRFGRHARHRALHAKGLWVRGTFKAAPIASTLCRAGHLNGDEIPVLGRFSNGGGDPGVPDFVPDVRGLAVKFELDSGPTDLVNQSVPRFFSQTPEEFVDFIRAGVGRAAPLQMARYFASHPRALKSLPTNAPALRPVKSYATTRYYGVHAFRWLDADGGGRYVRCDWRPEAGQQHLSPIAARKLGKDYLQQLPLPARFTLDVQIADAGDNVNDPSSHWPSTRRRVDAGTLTITETIGDPEVGGEIVVFDPVRITDGIELSADPVLNFRPRAYSESIDRRAGS